MSSIAAALSLECSFKESYLSENLHYACKADSLGQNIEITGNHSDDQSDENVTAFWLESKDDSRIEVKFAIEIGLRFPNLELIGLFNLNVREIRRENFKNLKSLRKAGVVNSKLKQISCHTFDDLESLKTLDLQMNLLKVLNPDIFKALQALVNIDLSTNKIIFLPENLFDSNKKLEKILLFNNRLAQIPSDAFISLKYIETIDLRYNVCIDFKLHSQRQTALLNEHLVTCEKNLKPENSPRIVDQLFFQIFFGVWT